jgi:preprotein translocase SecE subunit
LRRKIVTDANDVLDNEAESVVSDSRARRKRKRGEPVATDVTGNEKKGRPTPSRRNVSSKPASTSGLANVPVVGGIVRYLRGVISEMQKVTWPSREETINLTQVVLAVTIAFAIGLGLIDTFYTWWFRQALADDITVFLGIGVIVLAIAGGLVYVLFYRREDTVPY